MYISPTLTQKQKLSNIESEPGREHVYHITTKVRAAHFQRRKNHRHRGDA